LQLICKISRRGGCGVLTVGPWIVRCGFRPNCLWERRKRD
jgi:hypothetical protein